MVPGRTPSSVLDEERVALALRDRDRDDLVVEPTVLDRGGGPLVALAASSSCRSREMLARAA